MTRRGRWSGITATDQFCGAGGSTIGAKKAGVEIRLAMNHWERAVETYATNHQDTTVALADVSGSDPRRFPSTDILITSPECTTHSPAGGTRRSSPSRELVPHAEHPEHVRSRATMWDVPRFAEYHKYNLIITENVVEVTRWPLFTTWLQAMVILGYDHQIVSMNSMFSHPTPQSRDRVYIMFWKKGNRKPDLEFRRKAYCGACDKVTESRQAWKNGRTVGKHRFQYVYRCTSCDGIVTPFYYAGLNAIDLSIPGKRIGDRAEPLAERTLARAQYGLDNFGNVPLLVRMNSTGIDHRVRDATISPFDPQTVRQGTALVTPGTLALLLDARNGSMRSGRVTDALAQPRTTITTQDDMDLIVSPAFISVMRTHNRAKGLERALDTITSGGNHHLIISGSALISLRDSGRERVFGLEGAFSTQTGAANQTGVMSYAPFLVDLHGSGERKNAHQLHEALKTLPSHDRYAAVSPRPKLEDCYFRTIEPHEVGAGMAFPSDYKMTGNKGEQVKQFGNAVTPPAMDDLIQRGIATLAPEIAA